MMSTWLFEDVYQWTLLSSIPHPDLGGNAEVRSWFVHFRLRQSCCHVVVQ